MIPARTAGLHPIKVDTSISFLLFSYDRRKFLFRHLVREHHWLTMIQSIQSYVRSLNFKYRTDLRSKEIVYENAYGQFISPHRLKVSLVIMFAVKKASSSSLAHGQERSNEGNHRRSHCGRCWWSTQISSHSWR